VEERPSGSHSAMVVDRLFRSLAADQKNHAIGVILSGNDSDGATGLKTIKGEGGIALVQSPATASHQAMPRNSIAADHVDVVAPPAELALELGRLAYHFTRPQVRSLEEGNIASDDEQSFQRILQLLRVSSGLELRQYKPETLRRRIARRMILLRKDDLASYYRFLQLRSDEVRLLQEDLLINVTRFFRDPGFWESIRENLLPGLLKDRSTEKPIRVWCAGCSTGEEAYSLAITIIEYLTANNLDTPVQIFGTDASDQSVEAARIAIYPESLATEISPERLRRFFVKVDRGYQVSKRIRDTCIFARQNLCNDPPFSHIDILSCRNVMIYFNQVLQRQVMVTFHYALEQGGYMLLGMSEGLRDYSEIFSTVDRKHKIYIKTGVSTPHSYEVPRIYAPTQNASLARSVGLPMESTIWPEMELQRAADRIVLARFGPAGLIVDERLNVLQTRGQTGAFVELAPGNVSWNLLRVLREGIASETRAAVVRAIRDNIPATATATITETDRGDERVQIDVLPITSALARARCFLVLFQILPDGVQDTAFEQTAAPSLTPDEKERAIAQLRQDLSSTRFHLQSLLEERDARNQELVSANEEIQSANEELQSTNEELETTKEELQSANEELQTVNEELQQRNNTLTQTGNDLTNLLNSVNIPLLMLTSDFTIRQFTPPMQRLLSVRPTDIGRSISEIRLHLSVDDLQPILNEVLDTLGTRELEVQDRDGRWHLLRVRPYRTADNKIEGLVVLLLDIDQLRSSQKHLLDAHHFASTVVEGVPVPIVVAKNDCTISTANTAFRTLSRMASKELTGRSLPDLMQHLWGFTGLRETFDAMLADPEKRLEFEHQSTTADARVLVIRGQVLRTDGDRVLLLMLEDITRRREAEQRVAEQKEALEGEVQLAARTLNRTKEELRGLTAHLFTVQEEEREHVARELHDDISQRLSLLDLLLNDVISTEGPDDKATRLDNARKELGSLNTDVRMLSHRLHPAVLKDLGLPAALEALVGEFDRREGMPASFLSENLPDTWSDAAATALYRITQEALRNVAKHAGRTHVKVLLRGQDHYLELKVMDFGYGFDQSEEPPNRGLGLISMQERAHLAGGTFQIAAALGAGTTVTVQVPLS
jgi:two-component system CheB/CheR fusion protein